MFVAEVRISGPRFRAPKCTCSLQRSGYQGHDLGNSEADPLDPPDLADPPDPAETLPGRQPVLIIVVFINPVSAPVRGTPTADPKLAQIFVFLMGIDTTDFQSSVSVSLAKPVFGMIFSFSMFFDAAWAERKKLIAKVCL